MASNTREEKKTPDELSLQPFSKENLLFYYTPIVGAASYTFLSVNVLNPTLVVEWFPKRYLTNFLLFNSLLGTGCYIYSRAHLKKLSSNPRVGYSVYGSVMFSFSSVLLWAMLRSILPENIIIRTTAGIASSYILIKGGLSYLQLVDSTVQD